MATLGYPKDVRIRQSLSYQGTGSSVLEWTGSSAMIECASVAGLTGAALEMFARWR